ncbi:FG-GAP-like repeat-containing protein [Streptomyces mangrovisoli]|uniref:Integrin-like protein n=1 Tax=Streptomyces mangrovisoli TaxID=1428628 RepID=A0A1J4NQB9_9ACTN|nr:FG-GAP-like repeat-containing protein [Streptomyces mangrovisoli]OIJ64567.1 hypothetical protein WN71_028175 [Streptomyces mangrovisoli]
MHRPHLRLALATATAATVTGGLLTFTTLPAAAAHASKVAQADFNGDGFGDIATSAANATVSGHAEAGAVVAHYGSATGITTARHTTLSQDAAGVPGTAEAGDLFGASLAYADFNGDGYDDLAVGTPDEKVGSDTDGGTVAVLWGSKNGLTGKGITIDDPAATAHDYWGNTLAAGDFDGDGKDDLVVGNSSSTLYLFKGGFTTSGAYGSLTTAKAPIGSSTFHGPLHLTAGDVNGDGRCDLLVNGYGGDFDTNYLIVGTTKGLSVSQGEGTAAGIASGIGDINGDGYGDFVIGSSWDDKFPDGEPVPDSADGGKIKIVYGSTAGPSGFTDITQNSAGMPGTTEKGDAFGWDVDLGDVNGDGYQDVVVSAPGEDIGGVSNTGIVTVLYGSATGVRPITGAQSFAQSTAQVPGSDEKNDLFGADVKLDDVNGDGKADLIVGSTENSGNGAVTYLPSDGTRITTTGSRALSPSASGLSTSGSPQYGAVFAD